MTSGATHKRADLILVVDDDVDIREALADYLRDEGYEVATAANGAEALRHLQQGLLPCLILLDLMMPVMDGFKFLEALYGEPGLSDIPVVVITAGDARSRQSLPVQAVFQKPLDLPRLHAAIAQHC